MPALSPRFYLDTSYSNMIFCFHFFIYKKTKLQLTIRQSSTFSDAI